MSETIKDYRHGWEIDFIKLTASRLQMEVQEIKAWHGFTDVGTLEQKKKVYDVFTHGPSLKQANNLTVIKKHSAKFFLTLDTLTIKTIDSKTLKPFNYELA